MTALKAIKIKCLWCCCGSRSEVEACDCGPDNDHPAAVCPLWAFRLGKSPNKRVMSDEQRAASAERMAKMREKSKKLGIDPLKDYRTKKAKEKLGGTK